MSESLRGESRLTPRAIERIRSLPEFRRAREYRLYTGDGRRYLDLWADDGHAVGGHRSGRWRETLSNKLSRGLALPLPGPEADKLRRAVRTWLSLEAVSEDVRVSTNERPVYLFRDEVSRARALLSLVPELRVRDPLNSEPGEASSGVIVRAFSCPRSRPDEWILPVLPLPGAFAPCCLVGPAGAGNDLRVTEDLLAPAILAAAARAVYDVCRMFRSASHGGEALARRLSATGVWASRGPWLVPSIGGDEAAYDRLFFEHANRSIIVNPAAGAPSVVPAVMSKGEKGRILEAAERCRKCGLGR